MKKHGLLAFYKMNKEKKKDKEEKKRNNSLEIKTPEVPENVNSKKCGGCKNHKIKLYIYIQHLCLFRTMLNGESREPRECCLPPQTCLSFPGLGRSHLFPWVSLPTDIPAKSLSALRSTKRSFCSSLGSPFQQGGNAPGSNSWGCISRPHVNRYLMRSLDMMLPFALQKSVGSCGNLCLAPGSSQGLKLDH